MLTLLRSITIALGGAAAGLALASAWLYFRAWQRDVGERLFGFVALVRLGTAGLTLFGIAAIGAHLTDDTLSWRTPTALLCFVVVLVGQIGVLHANEVTEFDRRVRRNRRHPGD